ncbi:MAG TPA: redoxin domain-containing protein [Steroidobacteraceae bacterium]|nr:redoxin domain-containing protein [Steroidobacteraceae bacterium]
MYSLDALKGVARAAIFVCTVAATSLSGSEIAYADALSRVTVGAPAPMFSARGADGQQHRLSDYAGKLVVLEWTSPVCPFTAMKYKSGVMQALQKYAVSQRVVWLSIDTAAPGRAGYLSAAAARARIAETKAHVTAFLFDPDGRIGRSFGAKTTPSFFLIDRDGKLAYEGAMNEDIYDNRPDGADYIRPALDDLLAGRPVKVPETQPQGCAIEY